MPRGVGAGAHNNKQRGKPLPFPVVFAVLTVAVVFSISVWNVRSRQRRPSPSEAYRAAHGPVIETLPPRHSAHQRLPTAPPAAKLVPRTMMKAATVTPSSEPPKLEGEGGDSTPKSDDARRSGGGKPARPVVAPDVLGGGRIAGGDVAGESDAVKLTRAPSSNAGADDRDVRMALITTLKPCDRDAVFDAQLASVASWAALPLHPSPAVYLLDTEEAGSGDVKTCSQLIADLVPGVKAIRSTGASSNHGTALLGPMLRLLATMEPDAEVIGMINGDILLHPASVDAIRAAHRTFDRYFLVGRRASVDLRADGLRQEVMPAIVDARRGHGGERQVGQPDPGERAVDGGEEEGGGGGAAAGAGDASTTTTGRGNGDPFNSATWFSHDAFSHVAGDRIDAEDYFLFTRDFFDESALAYPLPSFHVGRPAYDNWLVHTAIHTLQPVIDATGGIQAYHQAHGYGHLKGAGAGHAGDDDADGAQHHVTAAPNKWAYWGSRDQQENYDLAMSHGGWRHGLFDFAPLHFVRHGAAKGGPATDAFNVGVLAAVKASDCISGVLDTTCLVVTLKPGWKPLGNDGGSTAKDDRALADMTTYVKELQRFVNRKHRQRWIALNKAAKNPFY